MDNIHAKIIHQFLQAKISLIPFNIRHALPSWLGGYKHLLEAPGWRYSLSCRLWVLFQGNHLDGSSFSLFLNPPSSTFRTIYLFFIVFFLLDIIQFFNSEGLKCVPLDIGIPSLYYMVYLRWCYVLFILEWLNYICLPSISFRDHICFCFLVIILFLYYFLFQDLILYVLST